jgi:F-type H+-transporting ATPase subunit c
MTSTTHWRQSGVREDANSYKEKTNMRRTLSYIFMAMALLCFAMPAFAQGGAASSAVNWVAIAAGFSMAIASAICGLGQGKATAAAMEGLARNPAARPGIQLGLVIIFVKVK